MAAQNSTSPTICAKRKGSFCTIYVDYNGQIATLSSYEDDPPGTLAQIHAEESLRALYRGYNFKFFDAPPSNPVEVEPVPVSKVQAYLESQGAPADIVHKVIGNTQQETRVDKQTRTETAIAVEDSYLLNAAFLEFKILLARYYANTNDKEAKIAVQAVANFLLAISPAVEPYLQAAKESFEKPRFTL